MQLAFVFQVIIRNSINNHIIFLQFTGSQESILQIDGEGLSQDSLGSLTNSPRHFGGISPLPEIRAVIISDRQVSYNNSNFNRIR